MDLLELDDGSIGLLQEKSHWWIKTRQLYLRDALLTVLRYRESENETLSILEVGCGSSVNLLFLRDTLNGLGIKNYKLVGFDPNLSKQTIDRLFSADDFAGIDLLSEMPNEHFDMVVSMDVLEHIEDDAGAIKLWKSKLRKSNSILFLSVPAFPCLWSYHDEYLGHKRRYRKSGLKEVLTSAQFEVCRCVLGFSYLFFPVLFVRRFFKGSSEDLKSDLKAAPLIVNYCLIFAGIVEKLLFNFLPFGTSIFLVAKNNHKTEI